MDIFSSLSAAFTKGGPIMWIMFLGQIVSFAIILERAYALYLRRSLNSKRIVKAFEADIKKGNLTK